MTARVVVVGDVAVDVLVEPRRPAVAGADVPARIRTRPGGAGANTAVWLAHLGAEVTLVGRVGDDPAGAAAAAGLRAAVGGLGARPSSARAPRSGSRAPSTGRIGGEGARGHGRGAPA
jgi:sugar/nucleoside kinase (ribokinase family)